jgi:hypothetical protein
MRGRTCNLGGLTGFPYTRSELLLRDVHNRYNDSYRWYIYRGTVRTADGGLSAVASATGNFLRVLFHRYYDHIKHLWIWPVQPDHFDHSVRAVATSALFAHVIFLPSAGRTTFNRD